MLYKGAAVAGGIGTVGGVTGVAVLANKDSANKEQLKKDIEKAAQEKELKNFLDSFGIKPTEQKGLFETIKEKTKDFKTGEKIDISKIVSSIEGVGESKTKNKETEIANKLKTAAKDKIKDKTKEDIEKIEFKQLEEFKDYIEEIKDKGDKKNNVCRVVQRELFLKLAESDFDFGIKKPTGTEENFLDLIKSCLTSQK